MKKLLIILAVGLSLSAHSQQINPTGTVSSLSVTTAHNYTMCPCDSVTVSFVYRYNNGAVTDFTVFGTNAGVDIIKSTFNCNKIFKMTKTPLNNFYNDTSYSYKLKISCNILEPSGSDLVITFSFKVQNSNLIALQAKNCTVGIEEYSADEQTIIYYNFSGQLVEPKQGELLIKQLGNKRIKVLIK